MHLGERRAQPHRLVGEVAPGVLDVHLTVGRQIGIGQELRGPNERELPAVARRLEELLQQRQLQRPLLGDRFQPAVQRGDVLGARRASCVVDLDVRVDAGVTLRNTLSNESSPNITEEFDCSPENGVEWARGSSSSPGSRWNTSVSA